MSDDDSVNGDSASVVSMNSERGSYDDCKLPRSNIFVFSKNVHNNYETSK